VKTVEAEKNRIEFSGNSRATLKYSKTFSLDLDSLQTNLIPEITKDIRILEVTKEILAIADSAHCKLLRLYLTCICGGHRTLIDRVLRGQN
jgi:hypothetical protein